MEEEVIKDKVFDILMDETNHYGNLDYEEAAEKIAKYIKSLLKSK